MYTKLIEDMKHFLDIKKVNYNKKRKALGDNPRALLPDSLVPIVEQSSGFVPARISILADKAPQIDIVTKCFAEVLTMVCEQHFASFLQWMDFASYSAAIPNNREVGFPIGNVLFPEGNRSGTPNCRKWIQLDFLISKHRVRASFKFSPNGLIYIITLC